LAEERRALLHLLARVDLSNDQTVRFFVAEERILTFCLRLTDSRPNRFPSELLTGAFIRYQRFLICIRSQSRRQ
jgi:hypothetical protein